MRAISKRRRVNLSKIDRHDCGSWRLRRRHPVVNRNVPVIALGHGVPDQLHLAKRMLRQATQVRWQADDDRGTLPPTAEMQGTVTNSDAAVLPGGRSVPLASVRVANIQAQPALCTSDVAGFIKTLLGSISAVGV